MTSTPLKLTSRFAFAVLAAAMTCAVHANDDAAGVADAVKEGLGLYKDGKLSDAAAQFDYAATLVRQQRAQQVLVTFPEPPTGWQAEPATSETAGAMFGGGITATRTYFKDEQQSVTIELVLDSPLLQSALAYITNPSLASMSGMKMIKVQGHKATLRDEDGQVEIQLPVNNSALFTVKGSDTSAAEVQQFANALLLNKL